MPETIIPEDLALQVTGTADDLAALDYTHYPYIERRWLQPGYIPVGSPVMYVAAGETGKGMLFCANAARTVLGLPFPNEDQSIRRAPGRVVWITGTGEDDPYEDMAPRLRSAIAHAVAEFGLNPELASERGAIRYVHGLTEWPGGTPVSLPADCPRIGEEIRALEKKYGGPPVALVVADSLSALLSDGYTVNSRQGARTVMGMISRLARTQDIAFVLIHHLTGDGKVAGSPAVLDSLRLVFVITRKKDKPEVRVITRHKSNISAAQPQGYVITGEGADAHAEFVTADDAREQRVAVARAAAVPAAPAADDPGPFRVLRLSRQDGADPAPPQRVGTPQATRAAARALADGDAGQVLTWTPRSDQGSESAGYRRGATSVAYLVGPARASKPA
jgi:hypothetical protein